MFKVVNETCKGIKHIDGVGNVTRTVISEAEYDTIEEATEAYEAITLEHPVFVIEGAEWTYSQKYVVKVVDNPGLFDDAEELICEEASKEA